MSHDATYPPLDTPKPLADDLWIVDSGPLKPGGMPLPVRMTVIRLANGDLMLHSPTRYSDALRGELAALGRIRHLIAPSFGHWTMLKEWQDRCPDTVAWAAPELRFRAQVKKAGLRFDHDLTADAPPVWADVIEQGVVPGGAGFREVWFFHRPSRTLVLTDLIENLEPRKLPPAMRLLMRLVGATAPDGKAPAYLRAIVHLRHAEASEAATRVLALEPNRVLFAHGKPFLDDASAELRRAMRWLRR